MVKLTVDLIAKQIPGLRKRRADESVESQLSRLTHLPLQHRMIDAIVMQKFCFAVRRVDPHFSLLRTSFRPAAR